ncbi:Hypothetical protein CINCED_3A004607 [Cinara cedri]|uniref:CWF19-like protein 2 n=1 Tax=Cinara cedri TaxID=506608 RepID=A0A5E4MSZ6_9HEMI|nr:Hypothetical protein CINCED_3A004607 [Cinara cedri]
MAKKSHKKQHKKRKHRSPSSSSSSTSSDEQWVESSPPKQVYNKPKQDTDNWMDFICNTSTEIEKKTSSKNKELEDAKARMEKPGQSTRELNPYWKNGGTGLPPPKPMSQHKGFLKPKIDDDDDDDGDDDNSRHYSNHHYSSHTKTSYNRQSWKKPDYKNVKPYSRHDDEEHYRHSREHNERKEERDRHHRTNDNERKIERNKRHVTYNNESKEGRNKRHQEYDERKEKHYSDRRKGDRDRHNKEYEYKRENSNKYCVESTSKETYTNVEKKDSHYSLKNEKSDENAEKPLTRLELNVLAAKQIKAELMGNTQLAQELQQKLNAARNHSLLDNGTSNKVNQTEEFVLLTRTSSKGYSYPVKQGHGDTNFGKKRREKVLTHEDGKRVRYFDDDDKYSLKSMFEKELTTTAEDSNMEFVKLSRKVNARDDEDDVFVERASEKRSAKAYEREVKRAINEHKHTEKVLNSCRYCFDSEEMLKHLYIVKGEKCYLCLPSYKSLTEGHCLIVPIYHYACATDIDEDVWTEMQVFRKVLTSMFKDQDEDVVFFESAMRLNNMPHMVWNCVPVPIEIGDTAPIYFKKALLECETEWAINKKVVDLSSKDIRRAIPKSLPYFAVDFGMQGGYAHVIEDEKMFPNNFAEVVIRVKKYFFFS